MDWVIVIISSLFSGLVGVGISNWYHRRNEKIRTKIKLLEQLFGNRYNITGKNFTEGLNRIF